MLSRLSEWPTRNGPRDRDRVGTKRLFFLKVRVAKQSSEFKDQLPCPISHNEVLSYARTNMDAYIQHILTHHTPFFSIREPGKEREAAFSCLGGVISMIIIEKLKKRRGRRAE